MSRPGTNNSRRRPRGGRPAPFRAAAAGAGSRRAFALLLVVLTIAALAALAMPFVFSMRLQERGSRYSVDQTRARYAVTAAYNHALAQLARAAGEYSQLYVTFDDLPIEFKWAKARRSLILAAEVEDEQGKLDLNAAPEGMIASLLADEELSLGLGREEAADTTAAIVNLRNDVGTLPTLDSLTGTGRLTSRHLDILRRYTTVHLLPGRYRAVSSVNFNTASVPVLRTALAGVRLRYAEPIPGDHNAGNGMMSVVSLTKAVSGTWEVKCTSVADNVDTGSRTFTFTVSSFAKDKPDEPTVRAPLTIVEYPNSPGGSACLSEVTFSIHNGTADFAPGDSFTFDADRFSYVGAEQQAARVDALLRWFRARVVSAELSAGAGTITVDDASRFPAAGSVMIRGDVIKYASRAGNELRNCTGADLTPVAGDSLVLLVKDMAEFDARLAEAVSAGEITAAERSAIVVNAKNPGDGALLDSTVGLQFGSSGRGLYTVSAAAVVNDAAGRTVKQMHIRRVVSLGAGGAWRIESQADFDEVIVAQGRDGLITRPAATYIADVAASSTGEAGVAPAPAPYGTNPLGVGWDFDGPIVAAASNSYGSLVRSPALRGTRLVPGEDLFVGAQKGLSVSGNKAFRSFAGPLGLDVGGVIQRLLVWVRPTESFDHGQEHVFFDSGPADDSRHVSRIRLFYSSDGALVFRIADEAQENRSAEVRAPVAASEFAAGSWHRIEAVWSGMDVGQMALLLNGRLVGSYRPKASEALDTAAPPLAGEKAIVRVGNYLKQEGAGGAVRETQAGSTDGPVSVYGYGDCRFVNQDGSSRRAEFNKVHRGGATTSGAFGARLATVVKVEPPETGVLADALVIPVEDASDFPPDGYVRIGDEIIRYTSRTAAELTVPAEGRGCDFGLESLGTGFTTEPADHANGAAVVCVSLKLTSNADYPMPHQLAVPDEMRRYFELSSLEPEVCMVQLGDEWISYTHRAGTEFLVNVKAEAAQKETDAGNVTTSSMRGAGGTTVSAQNAGVVALPVYEVYTAGGLYADGRVGAGDRVTLLDNDIEPGGAAERVVKHATPSAGGRYLVSFAEVLPDKPELYIRKGSLERDARIVKFPSNRLQSSRLASVGCPVAGAGGRADAVIGCVRATSYPGVNSLCRIRDAVDADSGGGFDIIIGRLDDLFDTGDQAEWDWQYGWFGVTSWPLSGFINIGNEAFFYKVRYPQNIQRTASGAMSTTASATVYGDEGIPATGNIEWTRRFDEKDPIAAGFNPHGGYLVITSYERTEIPASTRALDNVNQEILEWLLGQGYVTQEFADQHGRKDPDTGLWTFDPITVEGGSQTSERREFVRYSRIEPDKDGENQYVFHCEPEGRHLYDTHKNGATPLGHEPVDDGEGGKLYPVLSARTVALTVLQRGDGPLGLGSERDTHEAGSAVLPLPNVPAAIICGPPLKDDQDPASGLDADAIQVEDASEFPNSGYAEIVDGAGGREIIYYAQKKGLNNRHLLSGIKDFRGRFGTSPVKLDGIEDSGEIMDTSAAQIAAYRDPRRVVRLFQPRIEDRMPLLIKSDPTTGETRSYTPHPSDSHMVFFEAKRTVRGAKWLSLTWSEELPANTDIVVLARVGESPDWKTTEPVKWNEVPPSSGRVIYLFDSPAQAESENAINAEGDTITVRVFFKFKPGYDLAKWETPVLKSLSVKYQAGPQVLVSEVLDY